MLVAIAAATKEMEVREEDRVMEIVDMTEPAAFPELAPQAVHVMRKVPEAMYPAFSNHNVDFRKLVDEQKLTQEDSLLGSVNVILSELPYNV